MDRLAAELQQVQGDLADTRNMVSRLTFEMASRRAAFAEVERGIGEDLSSY